jgi:uncharacterized membrane protein YqjE
VNANPAVNSVAIVHRIHELSRTVKLHQERIRIATVEIEELSAKLLGTVEPAQ